MSDVEKFASAVFYDTKTGREQLAHDDPAEAICEHFENVALADGETLAERVESECPLTVYGFTRMEADLTVLAGRMADALEQAIRDDDELGMEPNYGDHDIIKWDRAALVKAIEDAIRPFGAQVDPWCCEQTSKREYTAEQVMAILPKCWFTEEPV